MFADSLVDFNITLQSKSPVFTFQKKNNVFLSGRSLQEV